MVSTTAGVERYGGIQGVRALPTIAGAESWAQGLEEVAQRSVVVASAAPGTIELRGAESGSQLIVFDAQGRVVVRERIGSSTAQVACPAGLHLWMLSEQGGALRQGKVLVH